MKIGIIFNPPLSRGESNWEASVDVLTQVNAVERGLTAAGHRTCRIPFTRDVAAFTAGIQAEQVDAAFNLCETVDEDPTLSWHPAALLELMGIPFSGSPSKALMLTTDKDLTKQVLNAAGIPSPRHVLYAAGDKFNPRVLDFPVIVKPRFEDASIGIDQESVFQDPDRLVRDIPSIQRKFGPLLVEEFIHGREFNLSLFGFPEPRLLPVAEIDFSEFPDSLYPIVGYRAKWDAESFEYRHTPRCFPQKISSRLADSLMRAAESCFDLFSLRDYGRVDVRVDAAERVFVLEVNANPCLSPDAGLAASFLETGRSYQDLVAQLAEFAALRSDSGESAQRRSKN